MGGKTTTCPGSALWPVGCPVCGHALNETVLFHKATGTLISADLLYNFQPEHYTAEKLFFTCIGCYGRPAVAFYHRFAISDKAAFRRAIEHVEAWPLRRIIMSHGRIVEKPQRKGSLQRHGGVIG